MTQSIETLERRIQALRAEVRRAAVRGDRVRARVVRAELHDAERAWDEALERLDEPPPAAGQRAAVPPAGPLLPVREQVHQTLTWRRTKREAGDPADRRRRRTR